MKRPLIAALALLALFSTAFALTPGGGGDGPFDVEVEFKRTFNLFPMSPVRVRGVEVGFVTELATSRNSDLVTVTLRLDEGTSVPADASAVIITSALLGERYVQLEGGTLADRLGPGDRIPIERTIVPFEFDEVLEGLNDFVGGLDEKEVSRLVTNLANLLEGNGAQLGETIDVATDAIGALKENDEELLALASAVSDLNETLATRDTQLAELLRDWIRVTDTLTSETTDLDGALDGLLVLTRQIAQLLSDHRVTLSEDIDTLTRVARTSNRNLDQVSTAILGSAELFRHAERVIDRQSNMLPLVNHNEELGQTIEESLQARLEGLCLGAGGTEEECDLNEMFASGQAPMCFPPIIPCEAASPTLADTIVQAVQIAPPLGQALIERRAQRQSAGADSAPSDPAPEESQIDDALDRLGITPRSTGTGGGS